MAARTPKAVKNQSGITLNTKMHLAEKAKHAERFMAYVNGKLIEATHAPKIVHVSKRHVNMDFTLNEEFSNNDLDFTQPRITGTLHVRN